MRNRALLINAAAALVLIAGVFVMRAAWERPPQAVAQQDCTEVQSFQGTGIQETQPFQVQSDTWRISYDWTATDPEFGGIFTIDVYEQGNDIPVSTVSAEQPGPGESFVNAGAGTYYLDITTALAEWTVTVEDCGESGGTPPPEDQYQQDPATVEQYEEDPAPVEEQYDNGELMKAGGPAVGPMPKMPDGSCPKEFPVDGGSSCHLE